ncbi:reverse transcriptase domain-containing protein, partial [Flavobacterium columnare]
MEFTITEVKNAYNKLKTYIYYDSGELLLREKLVVFETDLTNDPNDFLKVYFNNEYSKYIENEEVSIFRKPNKVSLEDKLQIITDRLNNYHIEPEFFNKYINEINVSMFPKKFSSDKEENDIISNQRIKKEYSLEKATAFIDIPIEIHILSVLWILRFGVDIDSKLFPECVGNRLLLNKDRNNIMQGSSLFKPYFKQYQKWRDGAVNVAKKLLDDEKNALFLNLDIKDYFYSVRISKDVFPVKRDHKILDEYYNLNDILLKVHVTYTKKIVEDYVLPYDFSNEVIDKNGNIEKLILPIGLLSSYVLANDYLKEFDKVIIEKYKPAYYGRYVDDILLVLSEPNPYSFNDKSIYSEYKFSFEKNKKQTNSKKEHFFNVNFEKDDLSISELYILNNFSEIVSLVNYPFPDKVIKNSYKNVEERIFKLNGFPSLFFQSQKTLLHFFDKDESNIVIDKLKKELIEKSSEFRDLPNEKNDSNNFEESAYYLEYDGSDGKIKTLKDYKEDRFGLSVYLSHKINFSLRNQKVIPETELKKIIKFFKGENCLTLYKLWEKILTLLLVNNQPSKYVDFLIHCIQQIDRIENIGKYSKEINENLKDSLIKHLF